MEMESEDKFYSILAICALLLILSLIVSCQLTNYRITTMVLNGVDPAAARCAVDNNTNADYCIAQNLLLKK